VTMKSNGTSIKQETEITDLITSWQLRC